MSLLQQILSDLGDQFLVLRSRLEERDAVGDFRFEYGDFAGAYDSAVALFADLGVEAGERFAPARAGALEQGLATILV